MTRTDNAHRAATVAALVLVLGACATASPVPSSSGPSAGTPETPSASQPPVNEFPSASGELAAGTIAHVVADGLNLRAEPSTGAGLAGTLARGAAVRIVSGPVEADGFRWFEVADTTGQAGWAADGDGTDAWLTPVPDLSSTVSILTLSSVCDVVGPFPAPATVVFEDGHVILSDPNEGNAWAVRRLSDAGMAEIRDTVIGNQYLQQSAEYLPELRPDAGDPPGHGACAYTFEIATGAEPIVVTSVGWFGDQEEAAFYQPSPERKALDGLARALIDIETSPDDDRWADAAALPYIASDYLLWIAEGQGAPIVGTPSVDPAAIGIADPASFGTQSGSGRCDVIAREEAFEAVRVFLEAAGTDSGFTMRLDARSFAGIVTDDGWLDLVIAPQTPDGLPSCEAATL
jgi:Bacterial SH3 domain